MSTPDPWAVLGLPPGSSVADARAARKALAKQLHPDVHAGAPPAEQDDRSARMVQVNRALTEIQQGWGNAPSDGAYDVAERNVGVGGNDLYRRRADRHRGYDDPHPAAKALDAESFELSALPAEAFEALFLVSYGLGDILVTEEPYLLELYLTEPAPCFCQLTLVPEAGGSVVTVEVSPPAEADAPPAETVRDVLVGELNRLATR
jgi:hypothetical protein